MNYVEARSRLVNWLRGQLMGPAGEGHLTESPLVRYPTGVLYPVEPGGAGTDPASRVYGNGDKTILLDDAEEVATEGGVAEERSRARPVRRRRYVPPSSVGFSFCVEGDVRLLITASGARYEVGAQRDERGQFLPQTYERCDLDAWSVTWKKNGEFAWDVWDGRAGIDVRARAHAAGTIFTVTLFNRATVNRQKRGKGATSERVEKSLFEARIECAVEDGRLVEYPRVDPSLLTEEERELELQYRDRRIYAVGHGAAVEWTVGQGVDARIRSEFMPAAEVPTVTVESRGDHQEALSMRGLAESLPLDALERFVAGYGDWIALRGDEAHGYHDGLERATALRMCRRMQEAQRRMREGVSLLRTEPLAARAFRMANRAMLQQMCQSQRLKGRRADPHVFHWRPFQLAFLLTALRSTLMEEDRHRDVLDLIWFPTGGGKTEAYLGLIAVLIVWRRLKFGSAGAGTVALMRYTLRLLTRQQFERAAGVVFALELMRRKQPELLGEDQIEVGIWVGGSISPNRFDEALEAVREIEAGKSGARQTLLVERCLWCGAELDVERGSYRATDRGFDLHCPDEECEFGRDGRALPCNVVDEALYEKPPSLLIGTIDKFARLAWEARAGAFFGAGSAERKPVRAPELVIQDELHLVTGALGSVAGLYEAGLDTLLRCKGVRAKYVASTATIRMAKQQVERLYARRLTVFPPPGLSCDDSWFARTDRGRPGRLYVGYLAPLLDQQHCLAPLAAVLLGAPEAVFGTQADRERLLDAWWTQVVYHGTLKSVGSSHNTFMTDVRTCGRSGAGCTANRWNGLAAPRRREASTVRSRQVASRSVSRRGGSSSSRACEPPRKTRGRSSRWNALEGRWAVLMSCWRPTWFRWVWMWGGWR